MTVLVNDETEQIEEIDSKHEEIIEATKSDNGNQILGAETTMV